MTVDEYKRSVERIRELRDRLGTAPIKECRALYAELDSLRASLVRPKGFNQRYGYQAVHYYAFGSYVGTTLEGNLAWR